MTDFALGQTQAFAAYGLDKEARINPMLASTLGGSALGFAFAPEGEGAAGALMGGAAGALGAKALGAGWRGARSLGTALREEGAKRAALEFGVGLPPLNVPLGGDLKLPVSVGLNMKPKTERLDGMNRWVDQKVLERAFTGTSEGLDAQSLMDLEASRGSFLHPLMGAGAAAALTHFKLPSAGPVGTALAGLLGGGAGALYNQSTANSRRGDMAEALRGVYTERGFPIQGQGHATANEAQPMLVSRGGGTA